MNNFYRALISLATVFPLSITFSYLYASWMSEWLPEVFVNWIKAYISLQLFFVLVACVVNLLIGWLILKYLSYVANKIGGRPMKIVSVKELGTDSLLAYLPYVLPLFIVQGDRQEPTGWLLGACLLLVLSWASMTIAFSPLLRICGLRFFEAGLEDGKTVTLLIRNKKLRPLKLREVAVISDCCFYGLK